MDRVSNYLTEQFFEKAFHVMMYFDDDNHYAFKKVVTEKATALVEILAMFFGNFDVTSPFYENDFDFECLQNENILILRILIKTDIIKIHSMYVLFQFDGFNPYSKCDGHEPYNKKCYFVTEKANGVKQCNYVSEYGVPFRFDTYKELKTKAEEVEAIVNHYKKEFTFLWTS